MEKTIIDERTGWEYELKGEQYYPTGRVVKKRRYDARRDAER